MPAPRLIGVYSQARLEISHRAFAGVVRFADEVGGMVVRDFRMLETIDDFRRQPPPWKEQVDGIVVMVGRSSNATDSEMADWVLSGRAPAVNLAADWLDARVPGFHVGVDSLARLAANHLVDCGCRAFLFVGYARSTGSAARGQAFREALAKQGRKLAEHAIPRALNGSLEDESVVRGETDLIEQLKRLPKPMGVWALNDNFANGVCTLCADLGLAIPEVVKVLGVDDLQIARSCRPALSSIRTPREQIAIAAMRVLQTMLDGRPGPRKSTAIPAMELVARASTAGAPLESADMQEALDHIGRHACAGLTVEQLVEALGISRRSLEERFRRMVGRSPGEEIQRVRLARAKELLGRTQLSITRIAAMIGFEETAGFSKFFHRETGVSPRTFRQRGD